jgi:hypothetical protein
VADLVGEVAIPVVAVVQVAQQIKATPEAIMLRMAVVAVVQVALDKTVTPSEHRHTAV